MYWLGCALPPGGGQLWLQFEAIDVPQDAAVVFADNTWISGDVGTLGGETLVRTEGIEILISTDRAATWTNVAPIPTFTEVAAAGDALIVFGYADAETQTVHVSRDAGATWDDLVFPQTVAGISAITPDYIVKGTGQDEREALNLRTGSVEKLKAGHVNPGPFMIAPNGVVMRADGESWWGPHNSVASFSTNYHPERQPWDYRTLRAAAPHSPILTQNWAPLSFTTDSRLLIHVNDDVMVSTNPVSREFDARDIALAGPGCTDLLQLLPRFEGDAFNSVVTNGADEPLWLFATDSNGDVSARGLGVEPGSTWTALTSTGLPIFAEDANGICVELITSDADTPNITIGAAR